MATDRGGRIRSRSGGAGPLFDWRSGGRRVRSTEIADIDLQPCIGAHIARTGEIGRAEVMQIEKKGKINRRARIALTHSEP
jgi:Ser-tRNA(Ala) deacylase AlaX